MIPRTTVAAALGLPEATDRLPEGDLPVDRFVTRYLAYLRTDAADSETPDAWTGTLMDHLIAGHPDQALDVVLAGMGQDAEGRLADTLADLAEQADPGTQARIETEAAANPGFAALLARTQED
ncbi:hypothetical protein MWU52_09690 [Jannaschia sp. S6380]|uniref:hypothetical protein n=1 Tax=Jannaschia sp. S6380 TaxID=2926408 RepID=UPI001FF6827F|nr:hypothetical protein [Jannaschia sp. S6380]MCK0167818.1 hypothetical protein [Jannaschia sp. S6380]